MLVCFTNLSQFGISGRAFGIFSSFLNNWQLWVVLDEISTQEYPVDVGVPEGSIVGPTLFLLYTIMAFLMMLCVILLSILMILLSALNMIRHLIFGNN